MKRLCAMILLTVLLTGCNTTTALRDEIVVTALGIHQKNGVCTLSVQSVEALKTASSLSEQEDTATAVYEASGKSVSAALHAFLNETGRETYILQNRILALSTEQCAAQSLYDSLDYFIRSEEGHSQTPVVVFRGDPSKLLGVSSGNDAIPARYLVGILRESADGGIGIYRDLLDIRRSASGMLDAALPILSMADDIPVPDGTALFRGGNLVGELNKAQTVGLLLLGDELRRTLYSANGVTYELESVKTKLTVERDGQQFAYHFAVTGKAQVVEQKSGSTVRVSDVETYLIDCMQSALRVLDSTECDPLGLARKTAQQYTAIPQKTVSSHLSRCDKTVSVTLSVTGLEPVTLNFNYVS